MLYSNTRAQHSHISVTPRNTAIARPGLIPAGASTYFQWRNFFGKTPDAQAMIDRDYEAQDTQIREEKYFLLPGRKNTITRMIDDEAIHVTRMVGAHGPLEEWEISVKTQFPIKRSFAAMIGQYAPRLRGSVSSASDAGDVAESWSRKAKYFRTVKTRRIFKRGRVKAIVSDVEIDGAPEKSIALMSRSPDALLSEIKRLGLKPKANTNFSARLLSA